MTTQKSKIAIISVIIVCFMISSAYIPAVNALSDDNDRDATYTNIEEVTDDSATGNFDINDLLSLIGGDGLKSVLAQLGLDEMIDQDKIQEFLNNGDFSAAAFRELFNSIIPEFDLESILKFIFSGDNGTKKWDIDTIDLGFATLNGVHITITYTDESIEGLQSVLVLIDDISIAVENANSGVKEVRIFFDHKDGENYSAHIRVQKYYIGDETTEINAFIGAMYTNGELLVIAGAFGYDVGVIISPEGELTFVFRIHHYIMQSEPFTGVDADMTLFIKMDCTMTITVNHAEDPDKKDVTDEVQAYADQQLKDGFSVRKEISDDHIEDGVQTMEYKQGETLSFNFTATSIIIGQEPTPTSTQNGIKISDPTIKLDAKKAEFDSSFTSFEAKLNVQGGITADLTVNNYSETLHLSPTATAYGLHVGIKSATLKITAGSIPFAITWGDENLNALTFRTHESNVSGLRASLVSAPVNASIQGVVLFTLVPETHAHLYSTDVMTKLTAWTVDSAGKCNHFISIESSYLYNHHIYIDLIDNNDKFDNVINIDISTPVSEKGRYGLKIGYGVGFGDPLTNFTSVTRTQSVVFDHEGGFIRESDGFGINRFVNSGEAFSPHFTVQIELSDDTVMMTAYVCHYKNGNVSISELGWRILIENGITAVFMYADGVHIGAATDTKRAYIDELSFGMAVNLHDASTKYHLYADSMTINGEEVLENVNINADVTAQGTSVSVVADKIGFDLEEGLVLIPGKTLKGTGSMNQDGIVSVDLYLQEVQKENAHIEIGGTAGNPTVDLLYDDTISGKAFKIGFIADSSIGVVRVLNVPDLGGMFKNVVFDETKDELTVGEIVIGNDKNRLSVNNMTVTFSPEGFGFVVKTLQLTTDQSAGVGVVLEMGHTDQGVTHNAIDIAVTHEDGKGITRTLKADLLSLALGIGSVSVLLERGEYSETTLNGESQEIDANVTLVKVQENDSNLFESSGVKYRFDQAAAADYAIIAGLTAYISDDGIKYTIESTNVAIGVYTKEGATYTGIKAGELKITQPEDQPIIITNPMLYQKDFVEEETEQTEFVMYFESATYTNGSNTFNLKEIDLSYNTAEGFEFGYDSISANLTNYVFKPTESTITADINVVKDQDAAKVNYNIDKIAIGTEDDPSHFIVSTIDCDFERDAQGEIDKNTFSFAGIDASVCVKDSFFLDAITVDADASVQIGEFIQTNDEAGNEIITIDDITSSYAVKLKAGDTEYELLSYGATIGAVEIIFYDDYLYVSVGESEDSLMIFDNEVYQSSITGIEFETGENHYALKLVAPEGKTPGLTIDIFGEKYKVSVTQFDVRLVSDGKENADIEMKCTTDDGETEIASFKMHQTMTIDLENFTANCELKTFELKVLNKELTMNGKLTAAVSATMQIQATMAFNMQYTHGSTSFSISAKDIVATVDVTKSPLEIKLTVGDAALAAAYGGRTVQANMSGSAVGTLSFTDSVIKGQLTAENKYVCRITEGGVTDTYTVNTKDDFEFTAVYDEDGFRVDSMRDTLRFVSIDINGTKVDIKEMEIYGLYQDNGKVAKAKIGMKLDFSFSLPVGTDHVVLSISGFDAVVEYQTSESLDFNATMTKLTYGTDKHTMTVSGFHLNPSEYVIDSVVLTDTDSKVDVTMEQCYYIGTFFASKMTGSVGDTDVSTISFTKEQTGDYYIGDFYFSISEGIKAYKNGEEKNPPKDAITLTVPHVGLTFTGSGKEWSIPIGTTVKFDDYYDVLDQFDLGLVAHTGDSYVMTLASVKASVAQPITVDEKGVVEVKGSGVVLTKEALDKITVDTITIKTGGDITVVISLDALKRLQSGTDKTVLAFEAFDATKDNIGSAYDRMSDADKAKAAAGRIVTVDVGKSTTTDKLGETKITIPFDIGTLNPNKLTAYFIDGDSLEKVSAATYSDGYVTFTTTHFSSFLICEELGNPPAPSNSNTAMIAIAVVVVICVFLGLLYCLYTIKPELFHKSQ